MSYFLDPPALFLLGMLIYYISRRLNWDGKATVLLGAFVSFILFMGGSTLLYLDIVDWPFPPTQGSVWMFHTNYTGIAKGDVSLILAVFMLLLYPGWLMLGYLLSLHRDEGSFLYPKVTYGDVKSRRDVGETMFTIKRGSDSRSLVREAIEEIGGIEDFVRPGDLVVIKPNISGGNPQIPGSFTSINLIDELVDIIQSIAGTRVRVVDQT
jgi:hypothetical protein